MTRMLRFRHDGGVIPQATGTPAKFVLYYELLDAFGKPGCPVCANLERGSLKALGDMLYEQVTDPASRRRLLESGGFCNWHTWMLPRVQNSPLGAALIYGHLLQEALERLKTSRHIRRESFGRRLWRRLIRKPRDSSPLPGWWRHRGTCPLCALAGQTEMESLRMILRFMGEADFAAGFARSSGLCLPHLCQAMEIGRDDPNLSLLLAAHEVRWSILVKELAEFARKCDYRFATEVVGQEGSSWRRVLDVFAGRPGVFGPARGARPVETGDSP